MLRHLRRPLLLAVSLASAAAPLCAQGVRNLGFEEGGIISPDAPAGWNLGNPVYRLTLNSAEVHAGRASLRSERVGDNPQAFGVTDGRGSMPWSWKLMAGPWTHRADLDTDRS